MQNWQSAPGYFDFGYYCYVKCIPVPVGVSTSQTHGHLLSRNVVHFQISIDSCHILGTETHGTNRLLKIVPNGLFWAPVGQVGVKYGSDYQNPS